MAQADADANAGMLHFFREADCLGPRDSHRRAMTTPSKDPLHGVTLEALLTELVAAHGWEELGRQVDVRCFNFDPSISSSLKFLRKTPWARAKVEALYIKHRKLNRS